MDKRKSNFYTQNSFIPYPLRVVPKIAIPKIFKRSREEEKKLQRMKRK